MTDFSKSFSSKFCADQTVSEPHSSMSLSRLRSIDLQKSGSSAASSSSDARYQNQPALIRLANDCAQLLYDRQFSDVCFVCCEGDVVHANRAFLAVRSDFFRGLLYGGLLEAGLAEIKLVDVPAAALRIVLRCLHTLEVTDAGKGVSLHSCAV